MPEIIKVTTQQMRETAQRYTAAKQELEGAYQKMDKAVTALNGIWNGPAYVAMMATWTMTYKNIALSEVRMRDAIDELNKSAEIFDKTESDNKSQFSALEVGKSPFDV